MPLLEQVLRDHPGHDVAPYAAALLFQALRALGQEATLRPWVARATEDPRYDDLRDELPWLRPWSAGLGEEALCGYAHVALHRASGYRDDELLWRAATCFELAGLRDEAIDAAESLLDSTPFAARASQMIARLSSR